MTLVYGQNDNVMLTKLALGTAYRVDYNKGNLIKFLNRLKVICYKSNDGGLLHKPYKVVVAVNYITQLQQPESG